MKVQPCKKLSRPMTFCTLAGVAHAELHGDEIVGAQKNPLTEVRASNGSALCALFANWPNDPKGILNFTKRYGVLREPPRPGAPFSFPIADWRLDQALLRRRWEFASYMHNKWGLTNYRGRSQSSIRVADGEAFVQCDGKLEYRTQSLLRLLQLELASLPPDRLRKCKRPGCRTYFFANHLKTYYCCDACGQWAQSEWKKNWWREHGAEWRQRSVNRKQPGRVASKRQTPLRKTTLNRDRRGGKRR